MGGLCHTLTEIGDLIYRATMESDRSLVSKALELTDSVTAGLFKLLPDYYQEYIENEQRYIRQNPGFSPNRPYYMNIAKRDEQSHMHISSGPQGYTYEMNGRTIEADRELLLDLINEANSNNMVIIDDGKMLWSDALEIIKTNQSHRKGRVTVITNESKNRYWKERGIDRLLTVIPFSDLDFKVSGRTTLKDVAEQLNAAFTSDYEKGGKVIVNPLTANTPDRDGFNVFEVVVKSDETLVMFTAGFRNSYSLYPYKLTMRAGGQEYDQKGLDGFADWIDYSMPEHEWKFISQCDKEAAKVFCAHFPALPQGTGTIDILEKATDKLLVEGLAVDGSKPETPLQEFRTVGRRTSWRDHAAVEMEKIACYRDRTVLTISHMVSEANHDLLVLGESSVLELNGGRTLKLIETLGSVKVITDLDTPIHIKNSLKNYVFQMVFEPMTESEMAQFGQIIEKAAVEGIPDYIQAAQDNQFRKYDRSSTPAMAPTALCRLIGPVTIQNKGFNPLDGNDISIDIYPAQ